MRALKKRHRVTLDGYTATSDWHVEQRKWVLTVYLDTIPVEAMEAEQRCGI